MSDEGLEPEDLQPGRVYRVEFQDCCVEGWFRARFQGLARDDTGYVLGMRFKDAYLDGMGGGWTIREVTL